MSKKWRQFSHLEENRFTKCRGTMPLIDLSVIVPVFNREKTITTCVEGILNTELKNYEVIIIDDGSSDGTLHLCMQLKKKCPEIRVFSIPNSGVSAARNVGIRNARGKYILFVDSDDTLCPNALERISKYIGNKVDLLMFSHVRVRAELALDSAAYCDFSSCLNIEKRNNRDIIRWIFDIYNEGNNDWFYIWNKAFKADIIHANKILFSEDVSLDEDSIFVSRYLKYVETLLYVDEKFKYTIEWGYEYETKGLGSMMRTPKDFFYNYDRNYQALLDLYQHSGISRVRTYAADYILDRPISRILAPHLNLLNKDTAKLSELVDIFNKKIIPVFVKEKKYIPQQKGLLKRILIRLLITGKTWLTITAFFVLINRRHPIMMLKKFCKTQGK